MESKRNDKSILFLFLILLAIMSISVGYASVNNIILEIGGTTLAEANKTLHIEYIEKNEEISTGGEFEDYKTENTLLQITTLKLPIENVTKDTNITINVHIKNGSDMSYVFKGVDYLTADDLIGFPSFSIINSNENIIIDSASYKDYIDEVIEAENDEKSGSMVIPITFKYANITNITDNTLTISLLLKFEKTEDQIYELKTGKDLYSVISSHYTDATNIVFCAKSEIPKGATVLGEAGLTEGEIKAYWGNQTIYIATLTRNSIIKFNADSGYMFSNGNVKKAFSKVKAIEVSNRITIDTSEVTNMAEMFKGCESLTNSGIQNFIDKFDTTNVTNMCAMFGSVTNITTIDLSGFDTTKVTDMSWMFENNKGLTNITFGSKFVTSAVAGIDYNQGMAGMFMNCESLRLLNLSEFDTSNVRSMFRMFENCKNLERIYASDKFKTTSVRAGSNVDVFKNCLKLEGGSGTKYENDQITDATYARIDEGTSNPGYFSSATEYTIVLDANDGTFENGESTKTYIGINKVEVDLSEIPTKENLYFVGWTEKKDSKIPMYYAGEKITFLKNVTVYAIWSDKKFYTLSTGLQIYEKISDYKDKTEYVKFIALSELPENCIKIANIDENYIDAESVDEEGNIQAFYNTSSKTIYFACKEEDSIILFNKDSSHMFSNGGNAQLAFQYVKAYEVSNKIEIDTNRVENFAEIFKYNQSLIQDKFQDFINQFETTSAKNMCAMFEYLPFSTIDVSHFDTTNVTDMSWMFHGSQYRKIIFGDNFNTSNVMNFDGMFQELKNMVTLDISMFKVKNQATINFMFGLCPKLVNIYVSENSNFENVKSGGKRTFENDLLLVGENGTKYSADYANSDYARIDTADKPGYFKNIANRNTHDEIYTLTTGVNVYNKISAYKDQAEYVKFIALSELPENSKKVANVDENYLETEDAGEIQAFYNNDNKTIYLAAQKENAIIMFNQDSSKMFSNGSGANNAFQYVKAYEVSNKVKIDTSAVENFAEMFKFNLALTQNEFQKFLNLFNTKSAKNMCAMFEYLPFSTIDVSHFNTTNVTDMSWMFHGGKFTNIVFGDKYDVSNVRNLSGMFQELDNIVTLDLSMFKIKNEAVVDYMFGLCPKLVNIYVSENSNFENAKQEGVQTFFQDISLVGENGTVYSASHIDSKYARIDTNENPGYFKNISNRNI